MLRGKHAPARSQKARSTQQCCAPLACSAAAHDCQLLPGHRQQIDAFEQGPTRGLEREDNVVELHRRVRLAHHQVGGVGRVRLPRLLHQLEHRLDIHQRRFDHAPVRAQEAERSVQLQDEGLHEDEVADGHRALHHALRGEIKHPSHPNTDDCILCNVEQREGVLRFQGRVGHDAQALVVDARHVVLGVEQQHGLEVQKRV